MKYFAVHSFFTFSRRRACWLLLALFWCVGLVLGVRAAFAADYVLVSMMRSAISRPVSVIGLLISYLLPFLFTVLAVFLSKRWIILPICFAKSFLYGLCAQTIALTFGNSSWLFLLLFLFSDTCMLSVLCWFSVRHIADGSVSVIRDAAICIVVFIILGILDYCFVSPFGAMLINN